MNYIFSSTDDLSAFWLFKLLRPQVKNLKLVTEEMLWYNRYFSLRISTSSSGFAVKLEDGTYISNNGTGYIINRLQKIPLEHAVQVQQQDLQYAMQESHAILFAALASFEDKINNPPTPNCLHGNLLPIPVWLKKVLALGGETIDYPILPGAIPAREISILVLFGELLFSSIPIPAGIRELCLNLSKWSNNPTIEFNFIINDKNWLFSNATLLPDFRKYLDRFNVDEIGVMLNKNVN
ncbi:hypothetical protein [Zunongwangia sp. H14]|uniref:hypothetical protein n=1 Tax=Zunongwangia sp. H14 TaxID=3240792 RepID=UPI0035686B7E